MKDPNDSPTQDFLEDASWNEQIGHSEDFALIVSDNSDSHGIYPLMDWTTADLEAALNCLQVELAERAIPLDAGLTPWRSNALH